MFTAEQIDLNNSRLDLEDLRNNSSAISEKAGTTGLAEKSVETYEIFGRQVSGRIDPTVVTGRRRDAMHLSEFFP